MRLFVGLDVGLQSTSVCAMDAEGRVALETAVASDPRSIISALRGDGHRYGKVVMEAGALSNWLCTGLLKANLPSVCIEPIHAHSVLKARLNKTDRNDARGLADLARTGLFKVVHLKSADGQAMRSVIAARRLVSLHRASTEITLRGVLRSHGLKVGAVSRLKFEPRVRELVRPFPALREAADALLKMRTELQTQHTRLTDLARESALEDPVCRLLMTMPGVGPLTALIYRWTIDDPTRFKSSRSVGAHLGLTRRSRASGESDPNGRISRRGDRQARSALYLVGVHAVRTDQYANPLREWAAPIVARRGKKKAIVAVARKAAVVLHRMWLDGTEFRSGEALSG